MSAVSAADATATPTETPTQAAPTPHGPLAPAIAILGAGVDPTAALVLSQVVLSFGIPFALVPLVALTARADVLGRYRNRWWTTLGGVASAVFLIALNGMLLWLVLGGAPPGG